MVLLLIRASVVIGVALVIAFALRRRSAAMRADLWRATFVALAVLPLAMAFIPALPWLPALASDAPELAATLAEINRGDVPGLGGSLLGASELSGEAALDLAGITQPTGASPVGDVSASPAPSTNSVVLPALAVALFVIWLAGTLICLVRLGMGLRQAASIAGSARRGLDLDVPEHVAIVTSERASGPFVWDPRPFGRATLVLPEDGAGAGPWRRAVIAHELHHIERHDGAFLAFATFVAALLWPTPLARLALCRLRLETERAADDAVIRAGVRASDYAGGLVTLASSAPALPVPGMASRGTLSRRVESLVERGADRRSTGRGAQVVTAGGALALCALVGCLSVARAQEPEEPAAQTGDERAEIHGRAINALVGMRNSGTGAWHGDVGYKLNNSWRVTKADVPHVGVTGLAVEALLLAGQTADDTPAGLALSSGIEFLLENQDDAGYFTANGSRMRSHAHATRALALALGAGIETDVLVPALVQAAQFIIDSQSGATGGWRFVPGAQDSDILETAYQHDALRTAARALGLVAPAHQQKLNGLKEASRRAWEYARSTRIAEPEHRYDGAFRYQPSENARVTVNTIAAGIAVAGTDLYDDPERWKRNVQQMKTLKAQRAASLDGAEGHFLTLDAELLLERVFDSHREFGAPIVLEPASEWQRERQAQLGEHQLGSGAWTCTAGPGDAYITAISGILLAPDR